MIALFDFDGVIMDTESQYTYFWDLMGEKYSNGPLGRTVKGQTLAHILPTHFDPKIHAQVCRELDEFEANMPYNPIKGAFEFLRLLKENGIPTAIVTSSNIPKMNTVYRQHPDLQNIVDKVYTSENYSKSKPDPECFLTAMKGLGGTPGESVVFEDSVNGLKAARASGGKVVGLVTSNPIDVVKPLSDICIDDFTEMTLKKMNALVQG